MATIMDIFVMKDIMNITNDIVVKKNSGHPGHQGKHWGAYQYSKTPPSLQTCHIGLEPEREPSPEPKQCLTGFTNPDKKQEAFYLPKAIFRRHLNPFKTITFFFRKFYLKLKEDMSICGKAIFLNFTSISSFVVTIFS